VARLAFQGLAENEIGRVRISMMARNKHVPFKGRIQKRKTNFLQTITFGLQRAAGPYSRAVIAQADVRSAGPAGKGKPFKVRRMASSAPMAFRRAVSITDLMSA
jgi:hypothetical protein